MGGSTLLSQTDSERDVGRTGGLNMVTNSQESGEKAGMRESRADLEMLLLLAESEIARNRGERDNGNGSREPVEAEAARS